MVRLEQLVSAWHNRLWQAVLFNLPIMLGVVIGLSALFDHYIPLAFGEHLPFWRLFCIFLSAGVFLMVPPVLMAAGPKPTLEDVAAISALRSALAANDDVSERDAMAISFNAEAGPQRQS